jgi:hypothetical protein
MSLAYGWNIRQQKGSPSSPAKLHVPPPSLLNQIPFVLLAAATKLPSKGSTPIFSP